MDSSSISAKDSSGAEQRIDVPMRSFQGGYYKDLFKLYASLGVEILRADFSYSFSHIVRPDLITTHTIYNGATGRAGVSISSSSFQSTPRDGWSWSLVLIYLRFLPELLELLLNFIRLVILSSPFLRPRGILTFAEWSSQNRPSGYLGTIFGLHTSWDDFVERILIPTFSAVCTAPREDVLLHPAEELLEYVWLTLFTHHYTARNGVRDIAERLSAKIHHIHLNSQVSDLIPDSDYPGTVRIQSRNGQEAVDHGHFSHVVFATTANIASQILQGCLTSINDPKVASLVSCLEKFTYRTTFVVNHTDETLLPNDRSDWRTLNLITHPNQPVEKQTDLGLLPCTYTMTTHILHSRSPKACLMQTTNPTLTINSSKILSRSELSRAVLSPRSKSALPSLSITSRQRWDITGTTLSTLGGLQGLSVNGARLWVCGSYASSGIPLLEGCVRSARAVVELGILPSEGSYFIKPPW